MNWFASLMVCGLAVFSSVQAENFPAQEVIDMAATDAEVRQKWIAARKTAMSDQIAKEIRAEEIKNTARLKEIILRYGLPTELEADLINRISRLVLHSSDLSFQKQFLGTISSAGNLWKDEIEGLTDRILLRQGLPQRYGTHLHHVEGSLIPYPTEGAVEETESDGPTYGEYIEMMREVDRALDQNCDGDLHKVIFNIANDFYYKPSDYLYYATFLPKGPQPEEEEGFLAFEDPALATAYSLCKTTSLWSDAYYVEGGQTLLLHVEPQTIEDATVLSQALYIYLIPRGNFQPSELYGATFLNRLLVSKDRANPIAEMKCNSAIEAIILGGAKIRISGAGKEYEFKETSGRDEMSMLLFFDATLENEKFN